MTQPPANSDAPPADRILALDLMLSIPVDLPGGTVTRATFAELTADLLARVRPDRIVLPLFTPAHDAMTVIERLQTLGYGGQIIVLSRPLPDPRMVQSELRDLGPGPRLMLLTPPDVTPDTGPSDRNA